MTMRDLETRLRTVRLVCTDVDGVLTDGTLIYGQGPHTKNFHVRDGAAIKWLQQSGIPVVFLSGLDSPATLRRASDLGVEDCITGRLDKLPALEAVCQRHGVPFDQVAHIGDDLNDLPLLRRVGLACCPAERLISPTVSVLNPTASIRAVYMAGGTKGNTYSPPLPDSCVITARVASFVRVILAPEITAPDGSVTVP